VCTFHNQELFHDARSVFPSQTAGDTKARASSEKPRKGRLDSHGSSGSRIVHDVLHLSFANDLSGPSLKAHCMHASIDKNSSLSKKSNSDLRGEGARADYPARFEGLGI